MNSALCKASLGFRGISLKLLKASSAVKTRGIIYDVTSDQEFEDKVKGSKVPVLVDFHASWCQPCKDLGPKLTGIAQKMDGKFDLAKVDVDEFQELAMEHNVTSVPTVIGMKNGKVVSQFIGSKDEAWLEEFTNELISK